MATQFPPDIASLVPLLASVPARKLRWGSEQDRAEDEAPALATEPEGGAETTAPAPLRRQAPTSSGLSQTLFGSRVHPGAWIRSIRCLTSQTSRTVSLEWLEFGSVRLVSRVASGLELPSRYAANAAAAFTLVHASSRASAS